jgi:hypothetical protein
MSAARTECATECAAKCAEQDALGGQSFCGAEEVSPHAFWVPGRPHGVVEPDDQGRHVGSVVEGLGELSYVA